MKKLYTLLLAFLLSSSLFSQREIKIGSGKIRIDNNTSRFFQSEEQRNQTNEERPQMVVLRFKSIPSLLQQKELKQQGLVLHDYIQDNMYYASIVRNRTRQAKRSLFSRFSVLSEYQINPLWKINPTVYSKDIPEHAKVSEDIYQVEVMYFDNYSPEYTERKLTNDGFKVLKNSKDFKILTIELEHKNLVKLAKNDFVKKIEYISPSYEYDNVQGRGMSRSNILTSKAFGQRGLSGKGVSVGIWDGNVEKHPDLGTRLRVMEFESNSNHGQHVSGTMGGSGLLDPRARGMAPEMSIYSWNFNTQSNGLNVEEEMLLSAKKYGISITQNSYGVPMRALTCKSIPEYGAGDYRLDKLVNDFPKLSHVFSVGNDQGNCLLVTGSRYYTSSKRSKNVVLVGALDEIDQMSNFSSWGPTDDGRIIPHVATFGQGVYSTVYNNSYSGGWNGTSMSSPVVSGTMSLLYEQYKKLYGDFPIASLAKAAILNTAYDGGNPGPDYKFGYGSLNGLKAVQLIEKKHFFVGNISQGKQNKHTIQVPTGVKQLKVMLVWTDREGESNNKALIDDLDLTLLSNGETVLPWVLDPANPNKNATRGIDRLNNQEQITVENPRAGSYTLNVNGFQIPEGVQQYSLVYEFVTEHLQVAYPNGGEKFNPGDKLTIIWGSDVYKGDYTIQISYDNGVTYETIADNIPYTKRGFVYTVPDKITSKGLIRIVQDGTKDVSDMTFSIMHTPQNLKFENTNCSSSSTLVWDEVKNAVKYKILKADISKGEFNVIGVSEKPNYIISNLSDVGRNIFSVVAIDKDGVESERAFAVMAEISHPLDLKKTNIPFEEDFKQFPSKYVKVNAGKGINVNYIPTKFQYTDAHMIEAKGNDVTTSWNATGDIFANNPEDVMTAKICEIDATGHSGNLWLRVAGIMGSKTENSARFRILANDKPITDNQGKTEVSSIPLGDNIMYWNLSEKVGSKFSINLQTVLESEQDSLNIGHIKLFQSKTDLVLRELIIPEKSASLTKEEVVTLKINNLSGEPLINIPVTYQVNDGEIIEEIIQGPIKPFKSLKYTFKTKVDLSKPDVLYKIKAAVQYPNDVDKGNDTLEKQTVRFGDYYIMPTTAYGNVVKATKEPRGFTDDGGKILNYGDKVRGGFSIEPTTKGHKVKIKFLSFDTEENVDILAIRNGALSNSQIVSILSGQKTSPVEYVSTAKNGGLYIQFISNVITNGKGWYAEISEVEGIENTSDNTFVLSSILNFNSDYTTSGNVKIELKNQGLIDAKDVAVRYKINDQDWVTEKIALIPAVSSTTYTFKKPFAVSPDIQDTKIRVEIVNEDKYMTDNSLEKEVLNDVYCFSFSNYSISSGLFLITDVSKGDVSNPTSDFSQGSPYPQYYRDNKYTFYKDMAESNLEVSVNENKEAGKIGVWIDWNNDKVYSEDELVSETYTKGDDLTHKLPIVISSDIPEGEYFARVRLTTASILNPCAKEYEDNGEVEDYKVVVKNNYPIINDVATISSSLADVKVFTKEHIVEAVIENKSSKPVSNFAISYKVNDNTVVTENVTASIEPFKTYTYTFSKKLDLSKRGYYDIQIYTELKEDQNPDNDKISFRLLNEIPDANGYYALNFDGADDILVAGNLNKTNLTSFTYEVWINPVSYGGHGGEVGFGRIFEGKNATIFLHGKNNPNYPEHSLVISSLGGGTYHTEKNSISTNRWQHLSITFDDDTKELKVYLDGVLMPLVAKREIGVIPDNSDNYLFIGNRTRLDRGFKGEMDNVRVWNIVRSQADIASNMHTNLAGAKGLIAEFTFNEGYFNTKTKSGDIVGVIRNGDVSNSKSSIWSIPEVGFNHYDVEGRVTDWEQVGENHYKTEIKQALDIKKIVANFKANMKNVTVKVNDVLQVSDVTTNDFSNSTTSPVAYNLSVNHLGKELVNTYSFELKYEKNPNADLLTFEIPSLSLKANPVTENIIFKIPSSTDVTALKPVFTTTKDAEVYVDGTKITSDKSVLDFSKPIVLKVLAENKRDYKLYSIELLKKQEITWKEQVFDKTYGDSAFELKAVASSGEEVVYVSTNPEVISVAHNKATIKGAGNVTLKAIQKGNGSFIEAESVEKEFIVRKANLLVKADDKTIDFSDTIPELTKTYTGFVYEEDNKVLEEEPSISTNAVQNSPVGSYDITLKGGIAPNYKFVLEKGILTIQDVISRKLKFEVKQGTDYVEGASILIQKMNLKTDANGLAEVSLKAGVYPYVVTKEGKEPINGEVTIANNDKTVTIQMVDTLPVYTINYVSKPEGYITGETIQNIKKGKNGSEVKAWGNLGFVFDKWDDGVNTPTRLDTNIQSDKTYTALFKLKKYILKYITDERGVIKGDENQEVNYMKDGTPVEVIPNPGYLFYLWSDGVKDNPRIDTKVTEDKEVTAVYEKIYDELPYNQDFEVEEKAKAPADWRNQDNINTQGVWEFKQGTILKGGTGKYAILDSETYGIKKSQDADLISPMFDLSNYAEINLKFIHNYKHYKSSGTLSYSIDGGKTWVEIQKWTQSNENPSVFKQQIDAVAGKSRVRFKWNYKGTWGYHWAIDDFELTGVKKSLGVEEVAKLKAVVYPNPFTTKLYIKDAVEVTRVSFYNENGQLIKDSKFSNKSEIKIDTKTMSSGVYLVKIYAKGKLVETVKVFK